MFVNLNGFRSIHTFKRDCYMNLNWKKKAYNNSKISKKNTRMFVFFNKIIT